MERFKNLVLLVPFVVLFFYHKAHREKTHKESQKDFCTSFISLCVLCANLSALCG